MSFLMSTEEAVHAFYHERLSNDPDMIRGWFTRDAIICINGGEPSAHEDRVTAARRRAVDDPEALRRLCANLMANWHWHDVEIISSVVDCGRAAVRLLVDLEYVPTGERVRTEMAEFFTFNGEYITELVAYVDTAMSLKMVEAKAPYEVVAA